MKVNPEKNLLLALLVVACLTLTGARGLAAVSVYDRVTTVGTPVYLKVLTKGRIFADGGRLVEFYLDDKPIGQNLTGGDGYGYRKFIPQHEGLIKVKATSKGESDTGLLLVMKKSDKAILIEIEGGFKDALISHIAAGASRQAVKMLLKKYRVIYLSRYTGARTARSLLDEMEFPEAPVLEWRGAQTLKILKEKSVNLYAIIGPAGVIGEADGYIEKRYTFDQNQKERTVKDWQQVMERLSENAAGAPRKVPKNKQKKNNTAKPDP